MCAGQAAAIPDARNSSVEVRWTLPGAPVSQDRTVDDACNAQPDAENPERREPLIEERERPEIARDRGELLPDCRFGDSEPTVGVRLHCTLLAQSCLHSTMLAPFATASRFFEPRTFETPIVRITRYRFDSAPPKPGDEQPRLGTMFPDNPIRQGQ